MIICLVHLSARPTPVYGEIATHFRAAGHQVWVASLDKNHNIVWDNGENRLVMQTKLGAYSTRLTKSRIAGPFWTRLRELAYVQCLRTMVRTIEPDVLQLNAFSPKYPCLLTFAMPKKTVFILDFRQIGDRRLPTSIGSRLRNNMQSAMRRSSAIFCFDHACFLHESGAEKGLGPHWDRWGTVIPMGVHDRFMEVRMPREVSTDERKATRFIYVGNLVRHRRLELLLEAISIVREKNDNFMFDFLGRDVSEGYLVELVQQLEIGPNVQFLPAIPYSDVPNKLVQYDVAIAYVPYEPTDWTYHPTLKVLEYRAIGIPIIATDVAPNRDYVLPGQNGLLCDNSAKDFASAMLKFMEDPSFLKLTRGYAGNLRMQKSWTEVSRMYEGLYSRLLSKKQS